MNAFSGSKITQQMYTRERRGVFRSTEGFDTVAKSDSLDNNFIKKTLHPFCLYDAPAELTTRGEKDESVYPVALHLFHAENGDTVIGLSRYQATDFTGQRSAFFAHNFVVPASRSEEIVQSYGDFLHADFARSYEGELGGTLPELSAIPVIRTDRRPDPIAGLRLLGINEGIFKALLQAVMLSVVGKKKIYIALNVPITELSTRAVELTEILYSVLPYEFRRRLGVITYANEPQSRKYIHLSFVEKGSLRPGDRNIEKDFTFDLVSGRMGNVDFGEARQPYADLVWKLLLLNPGDLDDFVSFADQMLRGESPEHKLSLAFYNELAVFYEIEQGNEHLYTENKSAVLSELLTYLKAEGAIHSRVRLNDIFLERFDREFDLVRQRNVPEPAIMECFKEYFVLKGHNYKVRIVDYFINGMLHSVEAGRKDVLNAAYGIIESNDELSATFFQRVMSESYFRKQLLEPYMESRLVAAPKSVDILNFVLHWGRFLPAALERPFAQDAVRDYLLEKLQLETDPVAAVAEIHGIVDKAEKDRRRGTGVTPMVLSLMLELAASADRFLLNRLSLTEMTQEDLLEVVFLRYGNVVDWQPPLDRISKQKENALRAAYRWFGEENPNEEIFAGLSPKELDDVQLLGRRLLKEARVLEPFERLPLAFYYTSQREDGPLDYDALLELVKHKAGTDKDAIYRFFAWSQGNSLFTISNKKIYPGYRRAILKYFLNSDREAFKNREFRKSYVATARPALQNVYNEARSQLASPLARWISRSRFRLLISGSITGILVIIAIIVFSMLRPEDSKTALPGTTPQPTPVQSPGSQLPPASVYLKDLSADEDKGSSVLVFTFANADDCVQFNPTEISLMTSSNVVDKSFKVAASNGTCSVPSTDGTDEGDLSGDSNSADTTDGTAEGADATNAVVNASPSPSPSSDAEDNTVVPSATAVTEGVHPSYQVEVTLEPGATIVQKSMIKAGRFTLIVDPAPNDTPNVDSSAEPSATASPEGTAE
ncbi:glycosyltransferase [Paenibacillus sp. FSL K6-0276]|uniref:GAP1-N2 domain-containing protein n=1 Tax=Paenibacillus sp. FSL K6-0276 TaxID=2921450 RepID=UPI0030EB6043